MDEVLVAGAIMVGFFLLMWLLENGFEDLR